MNRDEKLQEQLDHWFYKDSDKFREDIKMEQLSKAAVKYPKPFDPKDWTPEELAIHAMQENYDQQNYIYGLFIKIQQLEHDLVTQTENTKFWFTKCQDLMKGRK